MQTVQHLRGAATVPAVAERAEDVQTGVAFAALPAAAAAAATAAALSPRWLLSLVLKVWSPAVAAPHAAPAAAPIRVVIHEPPETQYLDDSGGHHDEDERQAEPPVVTSQVVVGGQPQVGRAVGEKDEQGAEHPAAVQQGVGLPARGAAALPGGGVARLREAPGRVVIFHRHRCSIRLSGHVGQRGQRGVQTTLSPAMFYKSEEMCDLSSVFWVRYQLLQDDQRPHIQNHDSFQSTRHQSRSKALREVYGFQDFGPPTTAPTMYVGLLPIPAGIYILVKFMPVHLRPKLSRGRPQMAGLRI
ncbi:hypothetical protein EYF80_043460 [Liparis tanakae]|uniref:Uncharacterized protein n=1 Tax=Liparis tanakae TaxID=230148 RepID=A0A4Z2G1E8_9TELE|nr:hypothetical protein EYF80_043460 [Liparis tanakae]